MVDGDERPIDAPGSEVPKRRGWLRVLLGIVLALVLIVGGAIFTLSRSLASDTRLDVGSRAPDFTLADQQGNLVSLSDVLRDHRGAVVAFYPKDFTPG